MIDKNALPELVELAKVIRDNRGEKELINHHFYPNACCCMGPYDGEYLCPCEQSRILESNIVEIVSQFDEDLAKRIWLAHFVKGLPG
jgi:hypothetical protein